MKNFSVSRHIQAPPDQVWAILTNGSQWTAWNPTIEKLEGRIAHGEKITVYSKANPGRAFPLEVTELEPPRRMVWSGGMPLGLFKGERVFELEERDGGTQFSMNESFTGLMSPLITRSIPDLQPSFEEFATALKQRAEQAT